MNRLKRIEKKMNELHKHSKPDRIEKKDGKIYAHYKSVEKEMTEEELYQMVDDMAKPNNGCKIDVIMEGDEGWEPELDPNLIRIGKYAISPDLKDIIIPIGYDWGDEDDG